ncbi:MAG: flagellar hook protein FlgE [Gammaproteobacteria bacterium]|nr:flagellar hook protein FlgE [Gammaproteobacteria bacterium]
MTFRVAISGLNAAQADLAATANNIANSSTTGFKGSRVQFAELYSGSSGSQGSVGSGVKVAAVNQQFSQGAINFTDNNLDLALSGKGFFVAGDVESRAYTRAGAFKVDRDGYVVNAAQQRLQVFPPLAEGGFNTSTTADLRVASGESPPSATGRVELTVNLPGNAAVPAKSPFSPSDPASYSHSTAMTVYDSLGAAHTATVYLSKTATDNTWEKRLYIDGNAVGTAQTLVYSNTGALVTPATGEITYPSYTPTTGAAPITLTYDIAASTQYGNAFSVNAINQDGYTTGRLIGVETSAEGVVQARFTNGRSVPLGQLAIAQFASVDGLQTRGDTSWGETFASGPAMLGSAGTGGVGTVQSGALEASNVDVTQQLVNMITAQRNFQANAKMISTADQLSQTIINIR